MTTIASLGTGVSGRLALLHARNQIELSQPIVIESIIGTTFSGSVSSITRFGSYEAILPCVSGTGMGFFPSFLVLFKFPSFQPSLLAAVK